MTDDNQKMKETILREALDLAQYAESYSREFREELERKSLEDLKTSDMQFFTTRLSEICEKYRSVIVKIRGTND